MTGSLCDPSLPLNPRAPQVTPRPADLTHPSFTPQIPKASISQRLEPLHRQQPCVWVLTEAPELSLLVFSSTGAQCRERWPAHSGSRREARPSITRLRGAHFVTHFSAAAEVAEVMRAER